MDFIKIFNIYHIVLKPAFFSPNYVTNISPPHMLKWDMVSHAICGLRLAHKPWTLLDVVDRSFRVTCVVLCRYQVQ